MQGGDLDGLSRKKTKEIVFDFSVEDFDVVKFLKFNGVCDPLYSFGLNKGNRLFDQRVKSENQNLQKYLQIQIGKKQSQKDNLENSKVFDSIRDSNVFGEGRDLLQRMKDCDLNMLISSGNIYFLYLVSICMK